MPNSPSSPDPLILALGAAVAGPKALLGKGGKSPVEGIFPSGEKGKALAKRAVEEGYLTQKEETVKVGRSKSTVVLGVITEKGLRAFVEQNSPKDALTALVPAVERLSQSAPAPDPAQVVAAIESSTAACVEAIQGAFAALRADVIRVVAPSGAAAIDPAPILTALASALGKVEPVVVSAGALQAAPVPPAPAPKPVHESAVADAIVSFITDATNARTVGCDFVELFDHLKAKHPDLSIGTFHDALRALDQAGRIRLKDWPRMQDDIPRPELALFVSHTVMYHVQPAR